MRGRAAAGNAPAPRTSKSNGSTSAAPRAIAWHTAAISLLMHVAEELQRQMQIVRLDPFHIGRRASQRRDQFPRPRADRLRDLNGDKSAKGLFHGKRSQSDGGQQSAISYQLSASILHPSSSSFIFRHSSFVIRHSSFPSYHSLRNHSAMSLICSAESVFSLGLSEAA